MPERRTISFSKYESVLRARIERLEKDGATLEGNPVSQKGVKQLIHTTRQLAVIDDGVCKLCRFFRPKIGRVTGTVSLKCDKLLSPAVIVNDRDNECREFEMG